MTPSKPAVVVPMVRYLREPSVTSEPRGAALNRRKSDAHIPPLHPEFLLPILAEIHRQQNSAAARTAARDARFAETGVTAVRAPVFHELVERIVAARRSVRAAEQGVRGLVIPSVQAAHELLHLPLFAKIVKIEEKAAADQDRRSQRDHRNLDDLSAPLFTGAVLLQIACHLSDYGSLLGRRRSRRIRFVKGGD